jgi:hypothetical protein
MSNNTNSCFSRFTVLAIVVYLLAGCGKSDSPEHVVTGIDFKLDIYGPETLSIADPPYYQNWLDSEGRWYLEGDGFLPPGTTCITRTCSIGGPFNSFVETAKLGQHELTWKNETTGESGIISNFYWSCYCGPPFWSTYVPVVPGPNRIVVTLRAGSIVQQDEVLVTRD